MNSQCIFCKIIEGAIPCHLLARTSHSLAFLDINPLSKNHFLIIPLKHTSHLHETDIEFQSDALKLAVRILKVLYYDEKEHTSKIPAYNILQNNGTLAHQEIMHVHFHVIPKYDNSDGLGIKWNPFAVSNSELVSTADIVRNILAKDV